MTAFRHPQPCCTATFLLIGALAAPAFAAPKIFVEQPTVDMGFVKEGQTVKHTFVIENRGDQPLTIKSFKPVGKRTAENLVKPDQRLVAPGKSIEVPVEIKPFSRPGRIPYGYAVASNDPGRPLLNLRVFMTVETLVVVKPAALYFSNISRGEIAGKHVDIMPGTKNAKLELLELTSDSRHIEPIIEEHSEPADNRTGVRVKVRIGSDAVYGRLATVLHAKVRVGPEEKTVDINAAGMIVGDYLVIPPTVSRTTETKRNTRVGLIILRANAKHEVSLKAAIPRSDKILTTITEQIPRKDYRVNVTLADDIPGGPFATVIDLYTDSPELPVHAVPVFVNIEQAIDIQPSKVILNPGKSQTVTFTVPNKGPLTVESVRCDDPDVVAKIIPDPERKHVARLDVRLKPDAKSGYHFTCLNIRTNIPGAQNLTLPVFASNKESQ